MKASRKLQRQFELKIQHAIASEQLAKTSKLSTAQSDRGDSGSVNPVR